jgi:hypothetical protein
MNHQQLYAYALGYYQGRVVGQFEYSGWEEMSEVEQHFFRIGYDRGVSDYCDLDVDEHDILLDINGTGGKW